MPDINLHSTLLFTTSLHRKVYYNESKTSCRKHISFILLLPLSSLHFCPSFSAIFSSSACHHTIFHSFCRALCYRAFPMMPQHPLVTLVTRTTWFPPIIHCVTAWPCSQALRHQYVCVHRALTCLGCSAPLCGSVFTLLPGWLVTLVTGCLKMDAVCLIGRAVFRSGLPPWMRQRQSLRVGHMFPFLFSFPPFLISSFVPTFLPFHPSFLSSSSFPSFPCSSLHSLFGHLLLSSFLVWFTFLYIRRCIVITGNRTVCVSLRVCAYVCGSWA